MLVREDAKASFIAVILAPVFCWVAKVSGFRV
jgi:hypothetical protein